MIHFFFCSIRTDFTIHISNVDRGITPAEVLYSDGPGALTTRSTDPLGKLWQASCAQVDRLIYVQPARPYMHKNCISIHIWWALDFPEKNMFFYRIIGICSVLIINV